MAGLFVNETILPFNPQTVAEAGEMASPCDMKYLESGGGRDSGQCRLGDNLGSFPDRYCGKISIIRFSIPEQPGGPVILCEDDGDGVTTGEKEKIFEWGFWEKYRAWAVPLPRDPCHHQYHGPGDG